MLVIIYRRILAVTFKYDNYYYLARQTFFGLKRIMKNRIKNSIRIIDISKN